MMTTPASFSFLINPASGGGAAPEAVVPIARRLRDHGASVEVTYSPGPEACQALIAHASTLGERLVAGSVYAGVDARAAEIVDRARFVPKVAQYPLAALRALATYTPARYQLTIDGAAHELEGATVVVANLGYYGKGMQIAPAAVLDDGLLDIVVMGAASRRELMRSLPKVYDGEHVDLDQVHVFTGRTVTLAATSRRPVPVGGDGEGLGVLPAPPSAPVTVSVRPGALTVIA